VSQQAHIYRWDRHGRKGQLCIVVARGTMNSCLVKFEDGYTMVTSRNALRLADSSLFDTYQINGSAPTALR
jgi:hypothetical protein